MSMKRKRDKTMAQRIAEAKIDLIRSKEELEKCLEFQLGHGDRVRATVRDFEAGKLVVQTNNENTIKIQTLKEKIKKLEKFLR